MKIIRTICQAVACAYQRWSDKQQDIYEDYQAKAGERHEAALKKAGLL